MHQTVVKGHANRVARLTQYANKGNLNIKDRYTGPCMGLMIGFVCYILLVKDNMLKLFVR